MSRIELAGVIGSNPLGFLAALGLLRIVRCVKLGFESDGSYQAFLEGFDKDQRKLAALVAKDAENARAPNAPWRFTYEKARTKKQGPKQVADLKPPPDKFRAFVKKCVEDWLNGSLEGADYAAAYATDVAVDGNGNTKPTAFHFTAAQQTFLGTVENIRSLVNPEWVEESLFLGQAEKPGPNLRWSPNAERNWALMANDPSGEPTVVDAPLEWLAFRGLPLLPSFPHGTRIITTCVFGQGDETNFAWPLWSVPASVHTVRSILQIDWKNAGAEERTARGIFAVCSSAIRRTSQGYGNFGPSAVT